MHKITIKEYQSYMNKGKSKYRNIKTEYGGVMYDSKAEARRAVELDMMRQAGYITALERQPKYPIEINGVRVFTYVADFRYMDTINNVQVIEDVKGMKTPMFNLKKKCVEAYYGIEIKLI